MKFKLVQLEAFVWVADLASFRKAAARLNTTQPNISARISALESAVGVTLMERDAGSVRLTTKGAELLNHARAVLVAAEKFVESSGREALYEGVMKLGVTELVVHTWLRDFLQVFNARFPNVLVELTVDLSVNLEEALFDRAVDLAFHNDPFQRRTSGHVDLGAYPIVWVAGANLKLPRKKKLDVSEIASYPVLTSARDTIPYEQIASRFREENPADVRLVPSNSLSACLHMTTDGMGIAALPETLVEAEIAAGTLRRIACDWVPDALSFAARFEAERVPLFVVHAAKMARAVASSHNGDAPRRNKSTGSSKGAR